MKILIFIIIFIIAFIAVLIIRAIRFKPITEEKIKKFDIDIDNEGIIDRFAQMIKCKTISYKDTTLEDEKEFQKFRELLAKMYPKVNSKCELHNIGRNGILYHWKGKNDISPIVLMAHYDVVPVDLSQWEKEPFSAIIENNVMWGRGTLDTKGTLCGIMEACEKLISDGFIPENSIYISFSGEEETNGDSAKQIVLFLKEKGIVPEMVLDEGGAIVQGVIPGVKEKSALVGTGEKGKMHLRLSVKSAGGHASSPPPVSLIGKLSKSVTIIENKPFKFHVSNPVKEMFDTLGRHSFFTLRIVFANLFLFRPLLDIFTKKTGGEINALFRTTTAFTIMKGSDAVNVFPTYASVEGDVRIMEGDTGDGIIESIKEKINDDSIKVEYLDLIPVKQFSATKTNGWIKLEKSIREVWGDVLVSPYLMIACSDSRHFVDICDNVYRFSAMELSNEERKLIHGNNERIPLDKLITTVKFYINFISKF